MAVSGSSKGSRVIRLDGERLGHIAGGVAALFVMGVSLYVHEADAVTTFIRSGWTFLTAYGATFFLVRVILRVTLHQVLEDRRGALEAKRARRREQRIQEQARGNVVGPMMNDDADVSSEVETEAEAEEE